MSSIRTKILVTTIFYMLSLAYFLDASAADNATSKSSSLEENINSHTDEGIRFSCAPSRMGHIETDMQNYLASMGITPDLIVLKTDPTNGTLVFTLSTPGDDFDTIGLKGRPEFAIKDQLIRLPAQHGKTKNVITVSKKEILLALLQHGRLTSFDGENCSLEALKEHVGIRQNIVAWAENLNWIWPNGGHAKWNTKYWRQGTPLPGVRINKALGDAFKNQRDYAVGCYTATKLVMAQGILDYYRRININSSRQQLIEARLELDQDPLVNIEPGKMWLFETNFDSSELNRPGKLLQIQSGVAPRNLVPGDWVYFLNTDPVSSQKTGYEGSNAIYLGRNKFDDYYNDNEHSYSYKQKLDEVSQWQNGVFSRSRDSAKIRPLSEKDYKRLGNPPADGGLLMDIRVFPYLFSSGELPSL